MKKRKFSLNKYFFHSIDYIAESRNYIYFIMGIFFLSVLIAYLNPDKFLFLNDYLKEIFSKAKDLRGMDMISFILVNNLLSAFMGILLGVFFGIFPVFNGLLNGVVIGYVLRLTVNEAGLLYLWRLLPHGIFELPAIFISLGMGLKLGMFIFEKNKIREAKIRIVESLRAFILIVVPLLVIAAFIEGVLITLFS